VNCGRSEEQEPFPKLKLIRVSGSVSNSKGNGGIFQKRKWSCPYDRIILILAVQFLDEIKTQEAGRRRQ
jgi:hypothetical protein